MAEDRMLQIVMKLKDDASKQMANISRAIGDNLKSISTGAAAVGAAVSGMAAVSLNNFANLGEQIDNFSKSTGIAAEDASAMKVVLDGMGSSLEAWGGAVKKMQINISNMGEDTKKANEALKPLGITFDTLKGKKPEDQFFAIGNAIGKIKDPAERTAAAVQFFGKSGADLLPIFQNGTASMDEFKKAAKDAGLMLDEVALKNATQLDDAMDRLNASVSGASIQIGNALAPQVTKFVDALIPVIQGVTQWIEKNPELTAQIIAVVSAVAGLIAVLYPLSVAVGIVSTALLFLAANPIILVIAALAALALAIYMMITHWDEFKAKVDQVWNAVVEYVTTHAQQILDFIATWLPSLGNIWMLGWQLLQTALSGVWDSIVGYVSGKLGEISTAVDAGMQGVLGVWSGVWGAISAAATGAIVTIQKMIDGLVGSISGAINSVKSLASFGAGGALGGVAAAVGKSAKGGKAAGGRVMAGQVYPVGEGGPELFAPDQRSGGGTIVPNSKIGGGDGGITIVIQDNTLLDSQAAIKIGDMIIERLRLQRRLA